MSTVVIHADDKDRQEDFLTHELDAQVICRFRWQGEARKREGDKKRERTLLLSTVCMCHSA